MLKYTKYILGAALVCFSTLTVVYAALSRESSQDKTNVLSKLYREEKSDKKSDVLLVEYKTKDSTYIAESPVLGFTNLTLGAIRNYDNIFLLLRNPNLQSFSQDIAYPIAKQAESIFDNIRNLINPEMTIILTKVNSKTPIKEASEQGFALIAVNYSTTAQSIQQQQININMYIDIRTKLTYLETFFDTLEAIKKTRKSINLAEIRQQTRTELQKNISKLSNDTILIDKFKDNIPSIDKFQLAELDRQYAEEAIKQIEMAGQITVIKTNVTKVMEENSNKWVEQIALLVKQELTRQAVPALW